MTLIQIALLAGALIGTGVAAIVWLLAPAQPDLTAALDNLAPSRAIPRPAASPSASVTTQDQVGLWVMRRLPVAPWFRPPARELAIVGTPVHRYYGEKVIYFMLGLLVPASLTTMITALGLQPPIFIPLAASLTLAVALSLIPDYNARSDAAAARTEFTRALSAYVDLVALERNAGSGPRQAMEAAAAIGDSWVFTRLSEELARSRWSGVAPWDSLTELAAELGLPELAEVSDIMRLSGEEGTAVYANLRARSASMRSALLAAELAKSNATGERMSIPVAALALVFLIILVTPAVLRVLLAG